MYTYIKQLAIPIIILTSVFFTEINAAETPETILIRQTLRMDLSGKRRSDSDLVISAYDKNFVAYNAGNIDDPREWNVLFEGRQSLLNSLESDLKNNKYELQRTIPTIKVRGLVATATSLDSGNVVNRNTGKIQTIYETKFWTLVKRDEKWTISSTIRNIGKENIKSTNHSVDKDIEALLLEISKARESGNSSVLTDSFSEYFIGYDAINKFDPISWNIIFGGSEEFSEYLAQRSPNVDYTIDRKVISSKIGKSGYEAVAMTNETVLVRHKRGQAEHRIKRNVFWTLSRQDEGNWKITSMAYNCGPVFE